MPTKTCGSVRVKSKQMRLDYPGIAEEGEVLEISAAHRLVETVLALSDNPGPENVERYLVASRALEDSRSRRTSRTSRAA